VTAPELSPAEAATAAAFDAAHYPAEVLREQIAEVLRNLTLDDTPDDLVDLLLSGPLARFTR
jgi:hypothetical protein